MTRNKILAAFAVATLVTGAVLSTADAKPNARFTHIDEDTGQGYYDGNNDGVLCTSRTQFVGYDWNGNPRFRKVHRCGGGFYW